MPDTLNRDRRPHPLASVGFASLNLVNLIASRLQASGHGAVVIGAAHGGTALLTAAGLRRIKTGLTFRPGVAFILIRRLLILGLAILRIDDQILLRAIRWRRR